jgi:hypothetical protein
MVRKNVKTVIEIMGLIALISFTLLAIALPFMIFQPVGFIATMANLYFDKLMTVVMLGALPSWFCERFNIDL